MGKSYVIEVRTAAGIRRIDLHTRRFADVGAILARRFGPCRRREPGARALTTVYHFPRADVTVVPWCVA